MVEDGRLLKILAHALGDGHIGGAFGTSLPKGKSHSEYRNYNNILLDQCQKDLQVFGQVPTSKDYNHHHLIFPNVIGYILKHVYRIEFGCRSSCIPNKLYSLPKGLIGIFIKAFADDESPVYDSSIEFYSTNKKLFQGMIYLINLKFPQIKISDIKTNLSSKNPKYSFSILSQSLEDYHNRIGFDHPEKTEDLLFAIERRKRWRLYRKTQNTPSLILKSLQEKEKTAKELSKELFVRHSFILAVLKKLERKNLVFNIGKTLHQARIWKIN